MLAATWRGQRVTGMQEDLFAAAEAGHAHQPLGEQSWLLRGFALPCTDALLEALAEVTSRAPLRRMRTPAGEMSVATSSCGRLGWVSDARGYRYSAVDPESGTAWPVMPLAFRELARDAASVSGFSGFMPDACLINRYLPGARMGLHQDRDERDFSAPIVSVSLGIPASFLFGGLARTDKPRRVVLHHGDVMVWGGVDRLRYHGVATVKPARHPLLGEQRINLTFRKAG